MQMRPLGPSGIQASVVGLGTWQYGGWMWGGNAETDSIRGIQAALDAGVNLIDTAPIYGFGLSESVVGKAIQGRRDDVVLATKCGMVTNTTSGDYKFTSDALGRNDLGHIDIYIFNSPDSIAAEVERSLKRLGTDHIDLYQTHWQESETPIEATMGVLLRLKEQGKIRAIGVCNASVAEMERYRSAGALGHGVREPL